MSDVKVELYIKLMDILQEFQLPGGKFDGHGLITALANAKRYEALQSRCEAAEKELDRLREAITKVRSATLFQDGLAADLHDCGIVTRTDAYMRGRMDALDEIDDMARALALAPQEPTT